MIWLSRSVPYMAYIAHVVTGVWCNEVDICAACVYCLCLGGLVLFQPEHRCNQWPQPISEGQRPTFKSQLSERPRPPKAGTHFTEWVEKTRRARARYKFNFCRGWDSNPQTLDQQSSTLPLSYHRSLNSPPNDTFCCIPKMNPLRIAKGTKSIDWL